VFFNLLIVSRDHITQQHNSDINITGW